MTIFAYVVEHDIGFAPNPFFGFCTLAACKPRIRKKAKLGDWIVGIGGKEGGADNPHRGRLVYAMKVEEKLTFDKYWSDRRFLVKRPSFRGSLILAQGDNAYHHVNGVWRQERCRHTHTNPSVTKEHLERDTGCNDGDSADCVLISRNFVYLGAQSIEIPRHLIGTENNSKGKHLSLDGTGTPKGGLQRELDFEGQDFEALFVSWLTSLDKWGCQGDPVEWGKARIIKRIIGSGTFHDDSAVP